MGLRPVVLAISAVAALALALAATALAAHVETSPAAIALYGGSTPSGFVAFTFEENETLRIPSGKSRTVLTLNDFRFHDACTKSLTRIHNAIPVRRNRFSYARGTVSLTGKMSYRHGASLPTVTGMIRPADQDCDGDADGSMAFDLKPPS
jgi:hypothetical protein